MLPQNQCYHISELLVGCRLARRRGGRRPEPIEDPVTAAAADDGSELETRELLLLKQPRMVLTPREAPRVTPREEPAALSEALGV